MLRKQQFMFVLTHTCHPYCTSYTGTLAASGTKFDSSRDRGIPFEFRIGKGEVIRGWDEGVMEMSLGEKAVLHITADYGYGSDGAGGGVIPPNADLDFEVELIQIGDAKAPEPPSGCGCTVQ